MWLHHVLNLKIYLSISITTAQCSDPVRIAKGFNDLFTSFFTHTDDFVETTSPEHLQNKNIMSSGSDQVLDKIKKLPADKAVGPDDISARMLKMCAYNIAPILSHIFNLSSDSSRLPMG